MIEMYRDWYQQLSYLFQLPTIALAALGLMLLLLWIFITLNTLADKLFPPQHVYSNNDRLQH